MLRIMKAIKKRQAQLSQLPSYFFKNILFKLCDRYRSESDWDRGNLVERLVVLGPMCISKKMFKTDGRTSKENLCRVMVWVRVG